MLFRLFIPRFITHRITALFSLFSFFNIGFKLVDNATVAKIEHAKDIPFTKIVVNGFVNIPLFTNATPGLSQGYFYLAITSQLDYTRGSRVERHSATADVGNTAIANT